MARGNPLILGAYPDGDPIELQPAHRLQHMSIVGQTGTGKSRYVESLIRQDIAHWPETHCGMIVVDPHGELFDGLMTWIAANKLHHLPIVPIDLRRQDTIISYNPLRQRAADPSVMIDNFVKAMAYVWGQEGTDATPLFERWATNTLYRLYQEKRTLSDAWQLFTPGGAVISDLIEDPMIRRDWILAQKNPKGFEEKTESSVNRFRRFMLNKTMRAMFGQTHASLDLGEALDKGQILLISLGRKRGSISQENADLFATLVISDLWTAAEERGKSEHNTPFYAYLDEFQRFVTPAMAQSLAESRGFAIGLTLANQFPRQVLNAGPHGPRIYDEIRENARTKIVFRLRGKDDLEVVANELFMGTFDPMRIKYQHYSQKVVGHDIQYLPSYGHSTTHAVGGGEQVSHSTGCSHSLSRSVSTGQSSGSSRTRSHTDTVGAGSTEGDTWTHGESSGTSSTKSGSHSTGLSRSETNGQTEGTGESFGVSGSDIVSEDEDEEDQDFDDTFDSAKAIQSWSVTESKAAARSDSMANQSTDSAGWSDGQSRSESTSLGGSRSRSISCGKADGFADADSSTISLSIGTGATAGVSESDSVAMSSSWSTAESESTNFAPVLLPKMQREPEAPAFWPIAEQLFVAMQKVHALVDREAYILAAEMCAPVFIRTPDVFRSDISPVITDLAVAWYQDRSGFSLTLTDALGRISIRDQKFAGVTEGEPEELRPRRHIVKELRP